MRIAHTLAVAVIVLMNILTQSYQTSPRTYDADDLRKLTRVTASAMPAQLPAVFQPFLQSCIDQQKSLYNVSDKYVSCFDTQKNAPLWTVHKLTEDQVRGAPNRPSIGKQWFVPPGSTSIGTTFN